MLRSTDTINISKNLYEDGKRLYDTGDTESGLIKIYESIGVYERNEEAYSFLGEHNKNIFMRSKDTETGAKAIFFYDMALKANNSNKTYPKIISELYLYVCESVFPNIDTCIELLHKALFYELNVNVLFNIAHLYQLKGDYRNAVIYYNIALSVEPDNPACLYGAGYNYRELMYGELAEEKMQRLLLKGEEPNALNMLGLMASAEARADDAIMYYQRAINTILNGDVVVLTEAQQNSILKLVYNNIAKIYCDAGKVRTSIQYLNKATNIDPKFKAAVYNVIFNSNFIYKCDVDRSILLRSGVVEKPTVFFPPLRGRRTDVNAPLNVGIITRHLIYHPVSRFIEPILKYYDKSTINIYIFYTSVNVDSVTIRCKTYIDDDKWISLHGLSIADACKKIYDTKIDILIETDGITEGSSIDIMASQPAPNQVSYIGYPDTIGIPQIKYRFVDNITDPMNQDRSEYTETLIRVSKCFLCFQPNMSSLPEVECPEGIVFGTFNRCNKYSSSFLKVCRKILDTVDGSKILFKTYVVNSTIAKKRIYKYLPKDRVILLKALDTEKEHLLAYNSMTVALDTFPYSGTTTTCDALYMGVPVITLYGTKHVNNVSASLLINSGMDEMVTYDEDSYVNVAHKIGKIVTVEYKSQIRMKFLEGNVCNYTEYINNFTNTLHTLSTT